MQPTQAKNDAQTHRAEAFCFYLVLLQMGFTLQQMLPFARCALTTPFHPYQQSWRYFFCGTFPRIRFYLIPLDVIQHPFCVEPGLSSVLKTAIAQLLANKNSVFFRRCKEFYRRNNSTLVNFIDSH